MKTFLNRIGACLACLGGVLGASSQNLSADEIGLVGSKLSEVQKTHDFFTFFHFVPIGDEKLTDGTTAFKPTGDDFRPLVTLEVTTDKLGIISELNLVIARSFIDDPKKCVYSADLAKSFLLDAAPTSTGDDVDSLAREIGARSMAKTTATVLNAQSLPTAPGSPSAAYQTYAGGQQPQTLSYQSGKVQILLQNDTSSNAPVLDLTASIKP